jgi:hypothetical protein
MHLSHRQIFCDIANIIINVEIVKIFAVKSKNLFVNIHCLNAIISPVPLKFLILFETSQTTEHKNHNMPTTGHQHQYI